VGVNHKLNRGHVFPYFSVGWDNIFDAMVKNISVKHAKLPALGGF